MTLDRQITEIPANQISTKRGFPVYRTNPSVPQKSGLPTRTKRIHVPGGKAAVIVDNSSGEIKVGGMGFWWEEEVDTLHDRAQSAYADHLIGPGGIHRHGALPELGGGGFLLDSGLLLRTGLVLIATRRDWLRRRSVQRRRVEGSNWETPATANPHSYWFHPRKPADQPVTKAAWKEAERTAEYSPGEIIRRFCISGP